MKQKKANQVFEIIRKLDKGEKRAFNLYASAYETKSNALPSLFNIIYDYTHALPDDIEPNEADITAQLKKAKLIDQYAPTKTRLKSLLLNFIYEAHADGNIKEQVYRKATTATLLIIRGHWHIGIQMLQEAKKVAVEYELFEIWLNCVNIEIRMLSNNEIYTDEVQEALQEESREVLRKIGELNKATHECNMARESHLSKTAMPARVSSMEELKEKISSETSFTIRDQYYLTLAMHSIKRDPPAVTAMYMSEHIRMLEDNIKPYEENLMPYFVAFGPYMLALFAAKDTNLYQQQLKKIEVKYLLYKNHLMPTSQAFVILNIYKYKLTYCRMTSDRKAMMPVVEKAESEFIRMSKMVDREGQQFYTVYLRNAFFYVRNYTKAAEWAVKEVPGLKLSVITRIGGYIIELICMYELGTESQVYRNKVKTMQYYLANGKVEPVLNDFLSRFIDRVNVLIACRNQEEKKEQIQHIREACEEVMAGSDHALRSLLENSQIRYWLETHLN